MVASLNVAFTQSGRSVPQTIQSEQITAQGDSLFPKQSLEFSSISPRFLSILDGLAYAVSTQNGDKVQSEKVSSFSNQKLVRKEILHFYGDTLDFYLLEAGAKVKSRFGDILSMVGNPKKLNPAHTLEIQVSPPQGTGQWIPASSLHRTKDSSNMVLVYETTKYPLSVGQETIIKIRTAQTGEQIREIILKRKPLQAQLGRIFHDSTGNNFFEKEIAGSKEIQEALDEENTPSEMAVSPNMPALTSKSRMLWFFKKPNADFPDSSLTFQLIANGKPVFDTAKRTGHMLLLSNLKSNTQYELKVTYALQPERSVSYYFYMPPLWYEKTYVKMISLAFVSALILGRTFLYFRRKNEAAERKTEETKQGLAAIRAQLNPHFVFNALNSIQALMHNNDTENANKYLGQFSKLLRTSLEPAYQGMIPIQKELELLDQYIALEQLRLPFTYEKQIAPGLDIHAIEIPGMLLQPLAENAIRHGLHQATTPHLLLVIKATYKDLILQVIDNGHALQLPVSEGYGLRMVQQKLTFIKQQFGKEAAIFALTTSPENTVAEIKLSKWIDS